FTERTVLDEISKQAKSKEGRKRHVLLFVHGYKNSFDDSIISTARIAADLQIPVVPIAYSWVSSGTYSGYWHDEDNVAGSSVGFQAFLRDLGNDSTLDVILVCHSMGARIVATALSELGRNNVPMPAIHHVVFAAADIPSSSFPAL